MTHRLGVPRLEKFPMLLLLVYDSWDFLEARGALPPCTPRGQKFSLLPPLTLQNPQNEDAALVATEPHSKKR